MNIHSPALWNHLLDYARAGRLLALLLGPPCETWSAARGHPLPGDDRRGPRPLRTAADLWGLPLLSLAELLQLSVGNCLLLKGIWLSVAVTFHSGSIVLEHPAMPYDEDLASVWRSGILCLLLRGGDSFRRTTIHQWRYGAEGVKPTMLLYSNGSLPSALEACELSDATKPNVPLIGRDAAGRFRTAKAKEYPSALSRAFALFFSARFARLHLQGEEHAAHPEMFEFIEKSATIDKRRPDDARLSTSLRPLLVWLACMARDISKAEEKYIYINIIIYQILCRYVICISYVQHSFYITHSTS